MLIVATRERANREPAQRAGPVPVRDCGGQAANHDDASRTHAPRRAEPEHTPLGSGTEWQGQPGLRCEASAIGRRRQRRHDPGRDLLGSPLVVGVGDLRLRSPTHALIHVL